MRYRGFAADSQPPGRQAHGAGRLAWVAAPEAALAKMRTAATPGIWLCPERMRKETSMTAQLIVHLLGDAKGQGPPKMGKGSGVRPLPNPQPMQYHPAWALHRSNKGQRFYAGMEGVGDHPGCKLQESAGTPKGYQARHQFFVYVLAHALPMVRQCLLLPGGAGCIARAGFPYGFCLLAGVDYKMQQRNLYGTVFSFVICLCLLAWWVAMDWERTSAGEHRQAECGREPHFQTG